MNAVRSVGAVLAGVILIFALPTATDEALHATGVMSRGSLPVRGAEGLILGPPAYRLFYSIVGCFLAERRSVSARTA